jgi:gliding motility-associated-like protein
MKKIEISYQYLLIGLFILFIEIPVLAQNFSGGRGDGYGSGQILGVDLQGVTKSLTVTLNKATLQADTTKLLPIKYEVVFSRPVTGFTFDDIAWSGTISASEITGELIKIGETYTINILALGTDGSLIPNIPPGIAVDANERLNLASTSVNNLVVYDITSPSPEIHLGAGQNNPTNATPVNFKVVFSENVIGFDQTKISRSGSANPTTMVVTGGPKEFNIAVSGMNGDGFVTIEIPSGQVADAAGNLNSASLNTQNSVEYLISPLTVTINQAVAQADPVNSLPIVFDVVFNRPVSGLTFDDFVWSGTAGIVNGNLSGSGAIYQVNVTGVSANGTLIASLPANSATDAAGNQNQASISTDNSVTFDNIRPSVEITWADGQASPTNQSPVNFKAAFSEPVTGLDQTKIELTGTAGATTVTVTGGPLEFNLAISGMTGDGSVVVNIPADGVVDLAGNLNSASLNTQNSVEYLISPLTVTINQAVAQADPVNSLPIVFDVVFNRPVTGLTFEDFVWSGTAGIVNGNLSGSGAIYQVNVTGVSANGTLIASLPANSATDAAGNQNQASISTDNSVTFDNIRPSVEITWADGQASPTNQSPVNFKAAFSEPVTGLDQTKIELTGTAGATTVTVTGGPLEFNLAISGMTGDGSVVVNIPADGVVDLAGNLNSASLNTQNSVEYLISPLTVTINQAVAQADPVNSLPIVFDVVFNRPVNDFTFDKVVLTGTASGVNGQILGTGAIYTVHITQIAQEGNVVARIPGGLVSDLFGLSNLASTSTDNSVTYDITRPTVEINLAPTQTTPTNEALISFSADFSEPVTGFEASDVQLSGNSGANTVYIRGGPQYFTIDISGMDLPGNVVIRIPQQVVNDPAGNLNLESKNTHNTVYFDNLKPDVTIRTSKTSPTPLEEIPLTIEFSKEVTGFELSDISVDNGSIISMVEQNPKNVWLVALSPTNAGMVSVQVPANVATDAAKNNNNASNLFQIEYLGEDFSFIANNIFTPNSSLNRFWIIKNIDYYKDYELIIRNKSGQEVYRTINYKNDWNGTYKNKPLPTGTYYFVYSSPDKKTNYKGYINIIYE